MVAGVAALIMSQRPELTHHQVRDLILQNTNLVSELQGRIVTGGHLDAHKALQAAIELNTELGVIFGGYGTQLGFDIQHPNGNIYDQVLMSGPMVKLKADANQITRVSFIDENDDIIQVEFSGSGTLTIDLDLATYEAPGLPKNYNQFISYVKGRAKILIEDADQSSFISVFSVGSITAINQSFIRTDINYNGQADIALVDISGTGFGGILCGNAVFASASGIIGIEAPNVPIEFRVIIGDIDARGAAVPVLNIGQGSSLASDAGALLVGGGDLFQTNGSRIFVSESGANPGYQSIRSISNVRSDGTALSARSIISGFQDRSGETVSIPFFVTQ